ncbi:MAG: hypothetical protein LBR80_09865, partial [Deltaproteobacteria bacterium]|nr:hypothetical protein [Deltaproteobacteria bacterium]
DPFSYQGRHAADVLMDVREDDAFRFAITRFVIKGALYVELACVNSGEKAAVRRERFEYR